MSAVFVGGRTVFVDGEPTDLVGTQRTGAFLRAAPATDVPQAGAEMTSVS